MLPLVDMANHSFTPNAEVVLEDNKAVMKATQQVRGGGRVEGEGMVAVGFEGGECDIFGKGEVSGGGGGWEDNKAVMKATQQVSRGGGAGGEGMVAVCFESGECDIF